MMAATASQQASPQYEYAFPIKEITPLSDYRLKVEFSNGIQGTVDFSWVLEAPAFERVTDPAEFAKVEIAPAGYITWGGDLDMGWESIYTKLSGLHWLNALPPSLKRILLVNAQCLEGGEVRLEFNNGVEGELELDSSLASDRPARHKDGQAKDGKAQNRQANGKLSFTISGDLIKDGTRYDTAKMYQALTGQDIDEASDEWNR